MLQRTPLPVTYTFENVIIGKDNAANSLELPTAVPIPYDNTSTANNKSKINRTTERAGLEPLTCSVPVVICVCTANSQGLVRTTREVKWGRSSLTCPYFPHVRMMFNNDCGAGTCSFDIHKTAVCFIVGTWCTAQHGFLVSCSINTHIKTRGNLTLSNRRFFHCWTWESFTHVSVS